MYLLCKFQQTNPYEVENNEDFKNNVSYKCIPVAALLMVGFSLLPFFVGLFEFINDPPNMWGWMFSIAISLVFTLLWI